MIRGHKVDSLQREVKRLGAGGGSAIHQNMIVRIVMVLLVGTTTDIAVAVTDVGLGPWSPGRRPIC